MKKWLSVIVAGTLALTMGASAHAEMQIKDWKTEGDGLIVFDTETGLEWLNLQSTIRNSINTITPLLETEFAGFSVANKSQIDEMLNGVMPSIFTTEDYYLGRDGSTDRVASPLVDTSESALFRTLFRAKKSYTYGVFAHNEDPSGVYTAGILGSNIWSSGQVAYYDLRLDRDDYAMEENKSGVYLVSQGGYSYSSLNDEEMQNIQANAMANVSSPLGLGVAGIALMGFAARRKL